MVRVLSHASSGPELWLIIIQLVESHTAINQLSILLLLYYYYYYIIMFFFFTLVLIVSNFIVACAFVTCY